MKFLQIKSEGEMALEAISLIAASTKRGDPNSIGMFGSGLKYAIASIIRQDIPFVVYSGEKEIRITTDPVEFGGKFFNRILINGAETSLTDSMGTEDWKGIFPFVREIYSNALDEDENATIKLVEDLEIEAGHTVFCLNATPEIMRFMARFDEYFVKDFKAITVTKDGAIHGKKKGTQIFRKGILAFEDEKHESIFSYDLYDIDINESRLVKNPYAMKRKVATMLEMCTNKSVLRRWINALKGGNAGLFEHECILEDWWSTQDNPELVEVILENKYYTVEITTMLEPEEISGRIGLSTKLLKRFLKYAPDSDILGLTTNQDSENVMIERKPSVQLFDKVHDAKTLLQRTAYRDRLSSTIKFAKFSKSHVLGQAKKGVIWLSIKLDVYGVEEIAKIIIEEQEHIHSGFNDETRNFQDHLFNLFYTELTRNTKTE